MANVVLPCDVEEWWEDKRLFMLLSHVKSVKEFETLISSYTREDYQPTVLSKRLKNLSGLLTFLKECCAAEEQNVYMSVTLPFIARSACKLDELVPDSGIPFIVQQEAAALVLGRRLVLSLIANAFLCTFPNSPLQHIQPFNFDCFFTVFDQKDDKRLKSQAAKLKCILCYFQRAAEGKCDLSGMITLRRQVVLKEDLPSLTDWVSIHQPLCNIKVDVTNKIEDSGSHTLQVDFANKVIGGGVLRKGCVQEEIKFTIFPELLVCRLIMDHMDVNEAIIITGAERFSTYKGYGSTFEFAGDYEDTSERDVFGNLLTSTVAIDAFPLGKKPEQQFTSQILLRELNKAFAGYFCQQDRGDMSTELLALSVKGPSIGFVAENYPNYVHSSGLSPFTDSALGNLSSSQPTIQVGLSPNPTTPDMSAHAVSAPPLSPIKEITESSQYASLTDSILKTGIEEATKKGKSALPVSSKVDGNHTVDQFASTFASSLFNGFQSEKQPSKQPEEASSNSNITDLASALTSDIIKSAKQSPPTKPPPKEMDDLTSSSSKTSVEPFSAESDQLNAGDLAKSILSDVLSSCQATSSSLGSLSVQTSGESTSLHPQPPSSFTDQMASSILADAFSFNQTTSEKTSRSPAHPAIFIQVERRGSSGCASPRSSRSSSLTGQSITLHEFTDDLAEALVRDGLSIAQYTSQSQDLPAQMDRENEKAEVNQFADRLVSQSITEGVSEHFKRSPPQKLSLDEQPKSLSEADTPSGMRKPLRHKLLFSRQELALAASRLTKRGSIDQNEFSDIETPSYASQLNPRLLTPSSSRMSMGYAWSTASTRDDDSRPVSPTDLDRIALGLVTDTDDYSHLYSKILVSDAILCASGERPDRLRQSRYAEGTLTITSLPNESKIDTFLSRLDQAEVLSQGSAEESDSVTPFVPSWQQKMKTMLLRPVATGNWGCGAFKGNPQLKSMLQWVVASSCGRPQMIYCSNENADLNDLVQVCQHLCSKKCTAGQLCQALLSYCKWSTEERKEKDLFTVLLNM